MIIYSLKTNSKTNPIGIDDAAPSFGYKLKSDVRGAAQRSYKITVAKDAALTDVVWNSGRVCSDRTGGIKYDGGTLEPSSRYYWNVKAEGTDGGIVTSETAYFETGLMGTDSSVWSGARWIGSPDKTENTDAVESYKISADFSGDKAGFAVAARNKDNYVLIEIDTVNRILSAYKYTDNAWKDGIPTITARGNAGGYIIPETADVNHVEISVNGTTANITVNGVAIVDNEKSFMPSNQPNFPREQGLMMFGINQTGSRAVYGSIKIENADDTVYQNDDFSSTSGVLSALGTVEGGRLIVDNEFSIVNPVPPVNVRKAFTVSKEVKSARLYSSAKGFYNAYINGEKVNHEYYNPGFTDYRKRIQYQVYDVTDKIKSGSNVIGATVGKGYYTGTVGYSRYPMIYGKQNYFIAKLVIEYTDGTRDVVVTDKTWQFTDKGAIIDSDYQQGESYDARLAFDWNDMGDARWSGSCGTAEWDTAVIPSNGSLPGQRFELSAQADEGARVERVITPECKYTENPTGHFVYDFGQNMVGTVRLCMKGSRGKSIKLRYGEMCYKDGRVYLENLRTAANTDTYTFRGDGCGEVFEPAFTSHGFRYMEISGNGCDLTEDEINDMIIKIEGLVITNTTEETGRFECSNRLVNRLWSNIMWGQRGNSLLVYTDCPQRSERMGWTGDAQVFAGTAAYNMDVRSFMDKWLLDLRDAQLLYNKDGAVPDTAPLGGDNRSDGSAGWGDAAVIVPWEMYMAYGDETILEKNYDAMTKWIEYQSRDDRQSFGLRTVDGKPVPEQSDLASIPYIQVQQRRGDHLAYDDSTPYILAATAYAAHCADIMAKTAEILGKTADAEKYRERFENIKKAFNEAWVCDDGTIAYWGEMSEKTPQGEVCRALDGSITRYTYYAEGTEHCPSQTAYALAIDFGLIPPSKMAGAAKGINAALERNKDYLTVGFLGISHLVPALTKAGLIGKAFKLLENEDNPSWLYSVKNGATTIWERWNSYIAETGTFGDAAMNSFNHYSYGAVGEWMFSDILGIRTGGKTGYKEIILAPTVGGSLTYARGKFESAHGTIVSDWSISDKVMTYKCSVPANTAAVLYLPADDAAAIKESGIAANTAEGVTYIGTENGRAVFELASGSYSFETSFVG